MQSTLEHVELTVGDLPVMVHKLEGTEALSRLFRFDVLCGAKEVRRDLRGQSARLTLRDGAGNERTLRGIVLAARREAFDDGSHMLRLTLAPRAQLLALGRDCRVFHDLTAVKIAAAVFERYGVPYRDNTGETYAARAYTAQYREDSWSFVSRLLEEEGVYMRFEDDGNDTVLVLEDTSTAAPELAGGARLTFAFETGRTSLEEHVHELARELDSVPSRFTVSSYDAQRPDFAVSGSAGDGPFEVRRAEGGGPEAPEICARRARVMKEESACRGSAFVGTSTSARLVPGRIFEIYGHPFPGYDLRYLVTATHYTVTQRARGDGGSLAPLSCRFSAVAADVPFRPARSAPPARQAGLQTGVVVGASGAEVFPDDRGRVRVQHHWDRQGRRDDRAGTFMRVAQRGTAGSMLLPRVGWTIVTFNEEGAVDAPSVLNRIHDGEHPPVYGLNEHNTRVVFRTATTPGGGSVNEIRFEDKKGAEEMLLAASRDMNVLVQHDKRDDVGQDASRSVGVDHRLAVSGQVREDVKRDQTTSIGASEKVSVGDSSMRSIGGDEGVIIAGSRQLKTGSSYTDTVTESRKLLVGAALIDASLGGISTISHRDMAVVAGGAVVRAASGSIQEDVGKVSAQAVLGLKLEIASEAYRLTASDRLEETVAGAMTLRAGGELRDVNDASASLKSMSTLAIDAPELRFQARERITLSCGCSALTVEDGVITITGAALSLSGCDLLDANAPKIEHNPGTGAP